jgi:hypothetical protein
VLAGEPGVIPLAVQPHRSLCNPRPPADARGANFCSWLKGLRDGWGGEILHCLARREPRSKTAVTECRNNLFLIELSSH